MIAVRGGLLPDILDRGGEKVVLLELFQASFEVAIARTSGLLNLVSLVKLVFWVQASTY